MREFVVDVGNSRIKWGECTASGLSRTAASALVGEDGRSDNSDVAAGLFNDWQVDGPAIWTLSGTDPEARDRLAAWLSTRGGSVRIIDDYRQVPLRVNYDPPESVGIDRLLNAVAIAARVPHGTPALIVNAGSAVTVDLLDVAGAFSGGAIFPGARMMAQSLHDYTARLPLVERIDRRGPLPPRNTQAAIACGIASAIVGGVEQLVLAMGIDIPRIFLAGGDAPILRDLSFAAEQAGPFLTLEGARIVAKTLK